MVKLGAGKAVLRSVRKLSALDRNAQGVKEVDVEWIASWLHSRCDDG